MCKIMLKNGTTDQALTCRGMFVFAFPWTAGGRRTPEINENMFYYTKIKWVLCFPTRTFSLFFKF